MPKVPEKSYNPPKSFEKLTETKNIFFYVVDFEYTGLHLDARC